MKQTILLIFFIFSLPLYSGTWNKLESMENGIYLYFDSYGSDSYLTTSYCEGKYPAGAEYFEYFLIETNDSGITYDTLWTKRTIWANPNRVTVKIGEAIYLNDKTIFGVGDTKKRGEKFNRLLTVKSNSKNDTIDFTFFDYHINEYIPFFKDDSLFSICFIGKDTSIVSIDKGDTWNEIILPDTSMKFVDLNIVSNSEIFALIDSVNNRQLIYSTDLGKSWSNKYIPNNFLRLFFVDSSNGFATFHDGIRYPSIYKTINGGQTWDEVLWFKSKYSSTKIEDIKIFNDTTYYAHTSQELFYSSDKGDNWEYQPFEMEIGKMLYLTDYNNQLLIIFMNDIGVYDNTTGIKLLNSTNNITIYPNPVYSGEEFHISENGNSLLFDNLIIYNLAGKVISKYKTNQILKTPQEKGIYIIEIIKGKNKFLKKLIVK